MSVATCHRSLENSVVGVINKEEISIPPSLAEQHCAEHHPKAKDKPNNHGQVERRCCGFIYHLAAL